MTETPRADERRRQDVESAGASARPERRVLTRRVRDRLSRFVVGLKNNARWMRKFLHGRK
jgi:hypothetical protein